MVPMKVMAIPASASLNFVSKGSLVSSGVVEAEDMTFLQAEIDAATAALRAGSKPRRFLHESRTADGAAKPSSAQSVIHGIARTDDAALAVYGMAPAIAGPKNSQRFFKLLNPAVHSTIQPAIDYRPTTWPRGPPFGRRVLTKLPASIFSRRPRGRQDEEMRTREEDSHAYGNG
jgi:hypothetical protein